jgi:hypothetical protein
MRTNFRKGDIVRDTLEDTDKWVGLVVAVKGQVAEVYYPQHSGRIWMPFDTLERVTDGESTLNRTLFPEPACTAD